MFSSCVNRMTTSLPRIQKLFELTSLFPEEVRTKGIPFYQAEGDPALSGFLKTYRFAVGLEKMLVLLSDVLSSGTLCWRDIEHVGIETWHSHIASALVEVLYRSPSMELS